MTKNNESLVPKTGEAGNIWPGITTDEAKAETLRRLVESSQPGNK